MTTTYSMIRYRVRTRSGGFVSSPTCNETTREAFAAIFDEQSDAEAHAATWGGSVERGTLVGFRFEVRPMSVAS